VSDKIVTTSGLGAGKKVADFKNQFSTTIPSMPDGYIGLSDAQDQAITYMLDISDHPELNLGIASIGQLPADVRVESVVVMADE